MIQFNANTQHQARILLEDFWVAISFDKILVWLCAFVWFNNKRICETKDLILLAVPYSVLTSLL